LVNLQIALTEKTVYKPRSMQHNNKVPYLETLYCKNVVKYFTFPFSYEEAGAKSAASPKICRPTCYLP